MATREFSLKIHNIGIWRILTRILFYTGRTHKIGEVHEGALQWTGWSRSRSAVSRLHPRDYRFLEGSSR